MTITVNNLSKSFGENKVIDNLSFNIDEGKITTLMGKSGCGKTTFGHLLLGILKPDAGTIEGLSDKSIAAVFQEDRLCEQLSAIGNIQLVLKKNKPTSEILKQFSEVGLSENTILKRVSHLSGGQKRRVSILRAIVADRDFICLDEPFKGLDKETKQSTMNYVKKHIVGKSVLFITHDELEAEFFGNIHYFGQ